CQLYDNFPF
nr:immunoglobulin light chain junction region [Macaca mulatta]